MIDVYITRWQDKASTAEGDISTVLAIERGKIGPETQVSCIHVVESKFCPKGDVEHRTTLIKGSQKRYGVCGSFRPCAAEKGPSALHIQERGTAESGAVFNADAQG